MNEEKFAQALNDVSQAFDSPQAIVASGDLRIEQKIRLLEQWERDLRQLLVASEENMAAPGPGDSGERLREVREALARLGAADEGADTGPLQGAGSPATPDRLRENDRHRRHGNRQAAISACAGYALVAVAAGVLGLAVGWCAGARAAPRRRY